MAYFSMEISSDSANFGPLSQRFLSEIIPSIQSKCSTNTESSRNWLNLGKYLMLADRVADATSALQRSLQLDTSYEALLLLGELSIGMGKRDDAIRYLKTCIELRSERWEPWARLSVVFDWLTEREEVIKYQTQALKLLSAQNTGGEVFASKKNDPVSMYIDLIKRTLTDLIYDEPETISLRCHGLDWPLRAHSMMGLYALDNIESCVQSIIEDGIEGDLVEAGVWRGGGTILMRAILKVLGDCGRKVWVCDSFQGLPDSDSVRQMTQKDRDLLAVSRSTVENNFRRYGMLDQQVDFLEGWFTDTLPASPIEKVALLRLDGDLYSSTWDSLIHLYQKVSPGGFVIIDDFGSIPECRDAVTHFRRKFSISEPIHFINWQAIYWRKSL